MILLGGRGTAAATSAVWMVIAARNLSVRDFSVLGLLLSLSAMVGVVADLGYPVVVTREVAGLGVVPAALLRAVVVRRLVGAIAASGAMVAAYAIAEPPAPLIVAVGFCGSLLATTIYSSVTAALRGIGQVRPDALNEVLSRFAVLGVGSLLLSSGGGVSSVIALYVAVDVGSAVILVWFASRRVDREVPFSGATLEVRNVLPIGAAALLVVVYYRIDVWLLGVLSDDVEVAHYVVSYRVLDGLLLPAGVVGALVVGRIARIAAADRARDVTRLALWTGGVTLIPVLAVAVVAEPLLGFTFGDRYRSAASVLLLLLASAPTGAAVMVMAPVVSTEVRHRIVQLVSIALVVNVALNVIVIRPYGARGAAAATAVSQLLLMILLYGALRQHRFAPSD